MARFFSVLVLAAVIGGAVAWQLGLLPSIPGMTHVTSDGGTNSNQSALALGETLYSPQPPAKALVNLERHGADPVVIGGTLTVIEKVDACAEAPGKILFVGQEIP